MALKRTLADKLFHISKISSQALTDCRISSPAVQKTRTGQKTGKANPGDGNRNRNHNGNGIFRRFLHKGAMVSPWMRTLPMGENLMERLREIDMLRDRIRLDGLSPVLEAKSAVEEEVRSLSVQEAKKLFRAAQLDVVKTRLRETGKCWISYSEFIRICGESCSDQEQGLQFAKVLDESGNVIVLGNIVVLQSEQVAKALGGLIPLRASNPNDPRKEELMKLEKEKAIIDSKADSMVRRELWLGLAFLMVQTAGFMRLTFWELTWDVMEPICFYVTSMYFMAGYTFFLRTSKEPSFEGFYKSRFTTKQKQLIEAYNFDIKRYNELKAMFPSTLEEHVSSSASFDHSEKMQIGALDH